MLAPPDGQTTHDAPQYFGSMSDAQTVPQACVPPTQVKTHLELVQVAVAEARTHFSPHCPQFSTDDAVSTHDPVHSVVPAGHDATQPATLLVTAQNGVAPSHFVVQLPHVLFAPSEVSQPFAT